MLTYLVAFVLSALTSVLVTPLVRRLAEARGWVDAPDARKVHREAVPRIGGIAIAIAFFAPVLGLLFLDNEISTAWLAEPHRFVGLIVGSMAIVLLGFVDDVRGLSPWAKLLGQIGVAMLAWSLGYRIGVIANPFGDPIALGFLSFPVTLLWIVGIVNAINLIDGLDGLATGISLFTVLTLFVLGVTRDNPMVGLASIALAGALVGFLRYNFNPATIFMGDSGSLFLGYVLAVIAISGSAKSSTVVSLLIPLLAMGLPVMDVLFALARRFLGGRPLFAADREHMHHKLLDWGFSQRQTVLVLYAACGALALGALGLQYANSVQAAAILAAFGIAAVGVSQVFGYLRVTDISTQVRYGLMRSRRLRDHLLEAERAAERIRKAPTVDEAVNAVIDLGKAVGADGIRCRLAVSTPRGLDRYEARWPEEETPPVGPLLDLEHNLDWSLEGLETTGMLSFRWHCSDRQLQIPEAGMYAWVALLLRDRALTLARERQVVPMAPRLARPPENGR